MRSLTQGDRTGTVWRPGETDVSIRPGWFYHPAEDARVRSVDNLVELFFTSVGRNSKLLLNVPPTPEGLFHATDVERLLGMRARLDAVFQTDLVPPVPPVVQGNTYTWDLRRSVLVNVVDLRERIEWGQSVARFTLEAENDGDGWGPLASGTTIGYRRLIKVSERPIRRVRLTVLDALHTDVPLELHLFRDPSA